MEPRPPALRTLSLNHCEAAPGATLNKIVISEPFSAQWWSGVRLWRRILHLGGLSAGVLSPFIRPLSPWSSHPPPPPFPGIGLPSSQNQHHGPAVGSLSLLQGIFPTAGSNPGLPHCRRILYPLSHKGSPVPGTGWLKCQQFSLI